MPEVSHGDGSPELPVAPGDPSISVNFIMRDLRGILTQITIMRATMPPPVMPGPKHPLTRAEREMVWAHTVADAKRTLRSILSEANRERLENGLPLQITGSKGTRFLVHTDDWSGNIYVVDEKFNTIQNWCVHPDLYDTTFDWYLPAHYAIAIQVMALQTDEDNVRGRANIDDGW